MHKAKGLYSPKELIPFYLIREKVESDPDSFLKLINNTESLIIAMS